MQRCATRTVIAHIAERNCSYLLLHFFKVERRNNYGDVYKYYLCYHWYRNSRSFCYLVICIDIRIHQREGRRSQNVRFVCTCTRPHCDVSITMCRMRKLKQRYHANLHKQEREPTPTSPASVPALYSLHD
jgi:hypothetical protein